MKSPEEVFNEVARAADAAAAVAGLSDADVVLLAFHLESLPATGVPGLIYGLLAMEGLRRFVKAES